MPPAARDLRSCVCGVAVGTPLGLLGRCNAARIVAFFSSTILRSLGVKCSVSSLNLRCPLIRVSPPFAPLQCTHRIGRQRFAHTCHKTGRLPFCRHLSTVLPFVLDQMHREFELACLRSVFGVHAYDYGVNFGYLKYEGILTPVLFPQGVQRRRCWIACQPGLFNRTLGQLLEGSKVLLGFLPETLSYSVHILHPSRLVLLTLGAPAPFQLILSRNHEAKNNTTPENEYTANHRP